MTAPSLQAYIQGQGVVTADNLNTFEQTCDTVAQLRSLIGLPGMQVFIRGTSSPNDGGGGPFYWNSTSTAADNGFTVIVPTGSSVGAWLRVSIAASFTGTNVQNTTNIASLRASISGSIVIFVEGYYTGADGGEGLFWLNASDTTSADNGGTIIIDGLGNRYYRETMGSMYNIRWFGAKGDNITDNTSSMNAAHATGRVIFYPQGTYKFTTLTAIAQGGIWGAGRDATQLISTDTSSANLIVFNSSLHTPIFKDFQLQAPNLSGAPVKSGGAGIQFNPTTGEIAFGRFDNVTIAYTPICVDMVAASGWTMTACEFIAYNVAGVQVNNTNNPDSGDSTISGGCLFNGTGAGAGINQLASGGLKVVGNKFLQGAVAYRLVFTGTNNTSDLLIANNSIENMTSQAIVLQRNSGTFNFSNILITGNQFAGQTTCIQTDSSNFINELTITGNVFNIASGSGFGINLATITDFNISANTFKGNGGAPTGITINASCVNGKIGKNTYSSLSATVVNNSTTTFVDGDIQKGTQNIVTNSAYGSLFSGTATITFTTPFTGVPVVTANVSSATGGGVGAIVTSVGISGFNLAAVGVTNGGTVPISWVAQGVV